MCGIAGIVGRQANEARIAPMVAAMARRGPDDRGVWLDCPASVALGHTRLCVIDLSTAGHQPMTFGTGRYWITYNGEVYNYLELRRELEADGMAFATHTDTEVVLAAFSRWGIDSLKRLRGMFAFGIWDRHERRLVLVRDRLGIKPLLWATGPGGLAFASEIKVLLASGMVAPVVEPQAVIDLLAVGAVCQPGTVIRGVQALEPGTCMTVEGDGRRTTTRYWDITAAAAVLRPSLARLSYGDNVYLIRQRLEEACRYHLIADVPTGSFLSGGVDSTAVTALMSRHMAERVRSFSVGFANTREMSDELDAARLAAEHIGCEHTEVVLNGSEVADSFDDLIKTIDQPSHDGANTFFVSRAARGDLTVALSGLGGDELFAGYPHFSTLLTAARRRANGFDRLLGRLHRARPNRWTLVPAWRCQTVAQRLANLRRILSDDAIEAALAAPLRLSFRPGFLEAAIQPEIDERLDPVAQTGLVECRRYLLHTLLRDADVMSMGHSLEVRPVLLDHVLVEHALALPPEAKIRNGQHKAVLKDAVRDLLPPGLLERPKTGFELPLGTWLRNDLRERLGDVLASATAKEFFAQKFLEECWHRLDDPAETKLIWTLLVFLYWARECRARAPT